MEAMGCPLQRRRKPSGCPSPRSPLEGLGGQSFEPPELEWLELLLLELDSGFGFESDFDELVLSDFDSLELSPLEPFADLAPAPLRA